VKKNGLFLSRYYGDGESLVRSRSQPFRRAPSLTIAVDGRREFSPEKRDSYKAYEHSVVATARPKARTHPTTVDVGLSQPTSSIAHGFHTDPEHPYYVNSGLAGGVAGNRVDPELRARDPAEWARGRGGYAATVRKVRVNEAEDAWREGSTTRRTFKFPEGVV